MFKAGHVYLQNNHDTDVVIELALQLSAESPTLRRGASVKQSVCIKRGEVYDMVDKLRLTRNSALEVLKKTKILERMPYIITIDADNRAAELMQDLVSNALAAEVPVSTNVPSPTTEAPPIKEEDFSMPSIAWPRTKLAEHAEAMGLEVVSTMTKAAILRKIRTK